MYAVVETGGKQHKITKNDVFLVEKLDVKEGATVKLNKVLLAKEGNTVHVGNPYVKGAHVVCEVIIPAERQDKVIAFKYKKRKSEKKKIGHRQSLTKLKVKEIEIAKG